MKKTKFLCLVCACLLLLSMFSSCKIVLKEKEHEPITIMNAQRDYRGIVSLVKEKYPEINIEIIPYRGRNCSAYMKQQLETGVMPDIYSTTQAWDAKYQKENLLDLSSYDVTGLYNTARINKYTIDGKLYLLPFDYTMQGICYNKTLFDKKNIDVPTSFEQLKNETIPALSKAGIDLSVTLTDQPGAGFNYFFNIASTVFTNTSDGTAWRNGFTDVSSDTFASDDENLKRCAEYFQQWLDCGLIRYEEGISDSFSAVVNKFTAGNTAFMFGQITRLTQNEDGTGDEYALLPFFSEDGTENTYITTTKCLYGLNKELAQKGNEQKLEDALHVLEVLSTNEGYSAINGNNNNNNNLCSIKDFEATTGTKYYADALDALSKGFSMDSLYVGWDSYLEPFGKAVKAWIQGKKVSDTEYKFNVLESTVQDTETCNAQYAFNVLDDVKLTVRKNGETPYYGIVTEELDTVQAAQLTGQIFMDATKADAALVSYNVYNPDIHPNFENSYGANGHILKSKQTKEYITIWLATGWSEKIQTVKKTGTVIKEMAEKGADTRATGFHYPYVFMSADGNQLEDDKEYTVVLVGYNKSEKSTIGLIDTGIVGLDAAMKYLQNVGEISSKTLDNSLVLSTTSTAK